MQKFIFLRIGLVLNLLEDAVGRLALARALARTAGLKRYYRFLFFVFSKEIADSCQIQLATPSQKDCKNVFKSLSNFFEKIS